MLLLLLLLSVMVRKGRGLWAGAVVCFPTRDVGII